MIVPNVLLLPSPRPYFKTSHIFVIYVQGCPIYNTINTYTPSVAKIFLPVVEYHFAMATLYLIYSCVSCIILNHDTQNG
jgi:hypothetical protein